MAIRVHFPSFKATITNIEKIRELKSAVKAVSAATLVLKQETRDNISLRDHSQADMAKLDHPYARRHGSIQIHKGRDWVVHDQSGVMKRSLRKKTTKRAKNVVGKVFFDVDRALHARYVIQGTNKMLPRDVLWQTAMDSNVSRSMMKALIQVLGADLRSKAGLRFDV